MPTTTSTLRAAGRRTRPRSIDDSISHSVVGENNWIISPKLVKMVCYAYLDHNLDTLTANYDLGIIGLSHSFLQIISTARSISLGRTTTSATRRS